MNLERIVIFCQRSVGVTGADRNLRQSPLARSKRMVNTMLKSKGSRIKGVAPLSQAFMGPKGTRASYRETRARMTVSSGEQVFQI